MMNQPPKILFLFPQYIYNSKNYIECEYKRLWFDTAIDAGFINCQIFYTDNISYSYPSAGERENDMKSLKELIQVFLPDVIFSDINFQGNESGVNPQFFEYIRQTFSLKVIGMIGDAWGDHGTNLMQYWSPSVDLLLYAAPPEDKHHVLVSKLPNIFLIPLAVNPNSYYNEIPKEIDVYFSGSLSWGLRPFWLPFLRNTVRNHALKAVINSHNREASIAFNHDTYEKYTRTSKVIVNFSSRNYNSNPVKALTGRAWQAIASGALLLEEDNEPIKHYFTPYVHYVPFKTVPDLEFLINFFVKNAEYRDLISQAGFRYCNEHYNSSKTWWRIINHLFDDCEVCSYYSNSTPIVENT